MSKLVWDVIGERTYETGVSNVALYPRDMAGAYTAGVAWSGVSSIANSPTGAEPSPIYADNIKYLNLISTEELGATIEAYMYPDEFSACNGEKEIAPGVKIGQQTRSSFGLAYKTILGNDTESDAYGHKLHILYGCTAAPSEKTYSTVNDSPEAATMSWELTTTPVEVTGSKPTAYIEIDSTVADPTKLAALEDILYGTTDVEARLPLPSEIITLMSTSG